MPERDLVVVPGAGDDEIGVVPADGVDVGGRGGGVAEDAGVGRVDGGVEELYGVAAAGRQQRRRRPREAHRR